MSKKEDRSDIVIHTRQRRRRSVRLALLAALGVVVLGDEMARAVPRYG
jgi:hypothetical protein